ncbi:XRE family transcriptional regulator [Gilvimarinus sp. 1_MG-2023]|uniref:XRE family transcriptional regulator n=1 Tax=Gilvimarinus sp. 1_MG-2023 TaxID=3062638 RepID=UPI0026E183DD|nr:XRE family transcriptional regulator [Gilvimarinus sp. 1_MG-2023]MDO6748532.1 XRE family transcriptional regulator [Gilvimarinus sp. 1_MG-2023]
MNKDVVIERINAILETEKVTRDVLSAKTGIGYSRWNNVLQGKAKVRHSEIEAIGKTWPEYRLWLAYGDEMPEAGQISPMTKSAQSDLGTAGKAG